jgi:hypothetical protein
VEKVLTLGTWYLVLGTWYLVLGTWYLVLWTDFNLFFYFSVCLFFPVGLLVSVG